MTPDVCENSLKSFKQRKTLATRKEEVAGIRAKFPTKLPVVVERYQNEYHLPVLDKMKFLVPQELTMSQFVTIIRNRLHLHSSQAFYLMVNNKSLASLSKTMGEIYRDSKDDDGFLYITYASQEMFGSSSTRFLLACDTCTIGSNQRSPLYDLNPRFSHYFGKEEYLSYR